MDRNDTVQVVVVIMHVALRKESVDRNLIGGVNRTIDIVALRKESVDRNIDVFLAVWAVEHAVALRKESVDRNRQRN